MLRLDSEASVLPRQAARLPVSTEQPSRDDAHDALIRWMPVAVPLSAALTLGVALAIWSTVP